MTLRICSLASGSKGNCTYVASDNTKLLVDAGLPYSTIKNRLEEVGEDISEISAIVITHEHIDHVRGLEKFNAEGVKIYAHPRAQTGIILKTGRLDFVEEEFYDGGFEVGDILVRPFRIPHDACYPLGYGFECNGDRIAVATDIGHITEGLVNNLKGCRTVLLEANHDVEMLYNNPKYVMRLKKRIDGANGHLSNETAAEVAQRILTKNLERIILAHLSEENNLPELAFATVVEKLRQSGAREGKDLFVQVAKQNCPTDVY